MGDETIDVIHLDGLVQECGWFVWDARTNNGYGCAHPKQEERDLETGEGRCFDFSCPVACCLGGADSLVDDPSAEALRAHGFDESDVEEMCAPDSSWMERYDRDPVVALPVIQPESSLRFRRLRHPGTRALREEPLR